MSEIRAQIILEVLGKPKEHVKDTLEKISKDFEKEKDISVVSQMFGEPKELEKSNGFFTGFLQIEFEAKNIDHIMMVCFKYMPANIDIITPEEIKVKNNLMNDFFNELLRKLHGYDEVARVLQIERINLIRQIEEIKKSRSSSALEPEPSDDQGNNPQ
jgi:hypothetical protein